MIPKKQCDLCNRPWDVMLDHINLKDNGTMQSESYGGVCLVPGTTVRVGGRGVKRKDYKVSPKGVEADEEDVRAVLRTRYGAERKRNMQKMIEKWKPRCSSTSTIVLPVDETNTALFHVSNGKRELTHWEKLKFNVVWLSVEYGAHAGCIDGSRFMGSQRLSEKRQARDFWPLELVVKLHEFLPKVREILKGAVRD